MGNSKEKVKPQDVLQRYELESAPDLSHLDVGDADWDREFDVTIRPLYSNYYEVGDRVIDTLGNVGTVVGIEYLGRSRRPIVWVRYDNNKENPQPEIPEALTPIKNANTGIFKVMQASVQAVKNSKPNIFQHLELPLNEDIIFLPETKGVIYETGLGIIRGSVYLPKRGEVKSIYSEDAVVDTLTIALALKLPVLVDWQKIVMPPHIAFNVAHSAGLF